MGSSEDCSVTTAIYIFSFSFCSDLIKDVAVSLVPLPLNKNDNIDPASLSGFEKSIKKVSRLQLISRGLRIGVFIRH